MNFFVSILKSKNHAEKITAIAIIVTTVLLWISVIALIVSSIVSGGNGGKDDQRDNTPKEPEIVYGTVNSVDDHLIQKDNMVNVRDNRSKLSADTTNQYYATATRDITLTYGAQKALDKMLVTFYNMNKVKIVTDVSLSGCNIPTISNANSAGLSFTIQTFNDKSIVGDATYAWIFTNAAKYGFVYSNDTFTYVGVVHATVMSKNGISGTDAYVAFLKNGSVKVNATDGISGRTGNYTVYYAEGEEQFSVPTNYSYTAEAINNGYIITVDMSRVIG